VARAAQGSARALRRAVFLAHPAGLAPLPPFRRSLSPSGSLPALSAGFGVVLWAALRG